VEDTFDEDDDEETLQYACSYGRGSAVLACLMFLLFRIHRLA
jgi:hypothetical protein